MKTVSNQPTTPPPEPEPGEIVCSDCDTHFGGDENEALREGWQHEKIVPDWQKPYWMCPDCSRGR